MTLERSIRIDQVRNRGHTVSGLHCYGDHLRDSHRVREPGRIAISPAMPVRDFEEDHPNEPKSVSARGCFINRAARLRMTPPACGGCVLRRPAHVVSAGCYGANAMPKRWMAALAGSTTSSTCLAGSRAMECAKTR